MKVKEKKDSQLFNAEELCVGDVFKHAEKYYMKCDLGSRCNKIECVELGKGDFCSFAWGTRVELIEGEFVCQ